MSEKISRHDAGFVLPAGLKYALLAVGALLLASQPALASTDSDGDRSSFGGDIVIQKGETARNVACMACSVYVHGAVSGNIAVMMGDVVVDGTVDGRVAVALGDIKVQQGGVIEGDTAIALGSTEVNGGSLEGRQARASSGPIVAVLLFPLLVVALVVWFLIWIIRRSRAPRYPYPPPPPPPGVR
jgi:hypothetical protein